MARPGRRLFPWIAGSAVAIVLLVAGAPSVVFVENRHALGRLSREQDARVARVPRRWTRPVHRGAPIEGDAVQLAQQSVLPDIETAMVLSDLYAQLHEDVPLESLHLADFPEARSHAAVLRRLRASTRAAYAGRVGPPWRSVHPPQPMGPDVDIENVVMNATTLALLAGSRAAPAECLATAADVARLGQDLTVGMTSSDALRQLSYSIPATSLACAARASPAERIVAAAEMESIARNTPPLGDALANEIAWILGELRRFVAEPPLLPWSPLAAAPRATGWNVRDAWALIRREEPTLATLGPEDYPAALDIVASFDEQLQGLDGLADLSTEELMTDRGLPNLSLEALGDALAQAHLRITAVALRALADVADATVLPEGLPALARDRSLVDPFSGQPLRWERADGSHARIWSVGHDRRDDGGTGNDVTYDVILDAVGLDAEMRLAPPVD